MSNSQPPARPGFRSYVIYGPAPYQQSQTFGQQNCPGPQFPHPLVSQLPPGHNAHSPRQEHDQRQGREQPPASQQDLQGQVYSLSDQQHSQPSSSQQDSQGQPHFSSGQQRSQPLSSQQHLQQHFVPVQQCPHGQQYPPSSQQYPQGQLYFSPGHQYPLGQLYSSANYQSMYTPGQPYPPHQYPPASAKNTATVRPGRRDGPGNEPQLEGWKSFDDKTVRRVFVRKVYCIIMLQLLFTLGIIALFVFEPNVKRFVQENRYIYFIALAVFVVVYLGLACFQSARRTFPMNIIMLILFTMAMSFMLGTISSYHTTEGVFMAVGICAAVSLLVSLFSFYTKFDFTSCGGILCILLLVLILFGLLAIFIPSRVMTMIYGAAGAIIFTIFLAYDTQMMMGGKNYELSPEEYIFAAIQIYIDIVYIFMFLLLLFDGRE